MAATVTTLGTLSSSINPVVGFLSIQLQQRTAAIAASRLPHTFRQFSSNAGLPLSSAAASPSLSFASSSFSLPRTLSCASASCSVRTNFCHSRSFSSRSERDGVPTSRTPPVNIGFAIVPQQRAYVIERLGKFHRVLDPGLHILIPIIDSIAYVHSLKEEAVNIPNQQAITMDNVTITIDGVLYLRVVDPKLASYGVSNMYYAMTQLAQTTMRSELGKMTLDKTFAERESLNAAIVHQMNRAAEPWGIKCLRYEIRDILPPQSVKNAMDMQAEAERRKRATILDSEGQQQSEINIADGNRQATALQAQGEADAIITRAKATAQGIELVSQTLKRSGGQEAAALRLAEQYVKAFGQLAKETNTMLLPANPSDPAAMIASALSIYQQVLKRTGNEISQTHATTGAATAATAEERAANEALLGKLLQSTKNDSN